MRVRGGLVLTALVSAVLLAGCSDPGSGPLAALHGGGGTEGDVLYVGTDEGVTALDVSVGTARFQASRGVAAPDWSVVFTTTALNRGRTRVEALDPGTGASRPLYTMGVPHLVARVAARGGGAVVLGPPAPEASNPYPDGRERTKLVVVRGDGDSARLYDLRGNYEPEAFSTDLSSLFVVDYTPAAAPTEYRVRRLDLDSGRVHDVFSRDKELQEAMPGTARTQTRSPDGGRLYTLYEVEDLGTAFIHVLDLDEQWAHCIDLPKPFGRHPGGATALTVTPDSAGLYVTDRTGGAVAEVDTAELSVRRKARIDARPDADAAASAMWGDTLFVGGGSRMTAISTENLTTQREWPVGNEVSAVQPSSDGAHLYVTSGRRVAVLESVSGRREELLHVPGDAPITSLGSPGLSPDRGSIQCAC